MGALKWGLKATLCNLRTIVHNCALLWAFRRPFLRGFFRHKMMTIVGNRGQLWTSALSPHLQSPHFRLSRGLSVHDLVFSRVFCSGIVSLKRLVV